MLINKDGQVLIEPEPVNKKTAEYLKQFWKFPTEEEIKQARENLYTTDKNWAITR